MDQNFHKINNSIIGEKIEFLNNNYFNGIFHYLKTINSSNNIYDEKIVELIPSSVYPDTSYHIKNLLDHQNNSFISGNNPNDNIIIDFKNKKINLKGYSIRSRPDHGVNRYHLKSWKVLGSNDRLNWFEFDKKINNSDINNQNVSKYFECSNNSNEFFEFIKIELIDTNWSNDWYFTISQLELFGILQ